MAASTSRPTLDELVSRNRAFAMSISTSSTTVEQLLFNDAPEVPYPPGSEKLCHAVEMTQRYAYDDSAPHIPQNLRGATPNHLKTDGKLRLYAKERGFIVSINPRLTHGMVLFMKGHIKVFAIVPMTSLRQGSAFRTLADKTADNIPLLEAPAMDLQSQQADNLFDRTVRTLWNLISQPESLSRLRELLMPEEDIVGYFNMARDNVDSITNALLPEVRHVLQSGEFSLRDLTNLRHLSADWPSNQASCIYVRIYTKRNDRPGPYSDTSQADINGNVGVYFGQTRRIRDRERQYRNTIVPGTRNPHLRIALKSSPEDRHMIPIMIWEDGNVSSHVLNMAEQTMVLLLRSYEPFLFVPENDVSSMALVNSRRAKLLASFQATAASTTGWPRINGRGCNQESPLYGSTRSIYKFLSIPMAPGNPNVRSFTSYRLRRTLFYYDAQAALMEMKLNVHYSDTNIRAYHQSFRVRNATLNAQRPKYGYLVIEVMDDGKPHTSPYMGVPSVGPFENFSQASSFGIHIEWFNESAQRWCKATVARIGYINEGRIAATGDVEGCLKPYREAMLLLQGLKGLQYTGTLNGFPKRVVIQGQGISVLRTNHLQQEYRLDPQSGVSSPAPARSSWQQNCRRMLNEFSCDVTRVLLEAPAANDPTMLFTASDAKNAGLLTSKGKKRPCDTCYLAYSGSTIIVCEPDTSNPYGCCRLCSLFSRPCTFTAISQLSPLLGDRQPWRHSTFALSLYPNGPFRWLIYHRSISDEELDADVFVQEPFEERFGLLEDDDDDADGGENVEA